MRMRFLSGVLLSLLCVLYCLYSGASLTADAAMSGGRYLTPSEALQVFGSEIPAKYYNGSGYTDVVFRYVRSSTIGDIDSPDNTSEYLATGRTVLYYGIVGTHTATLSPDYITFDITPTYSLFDTTQIHSIIGLSTNSEIPIAYQSPAWRWYIGGSSYVFENSDTATSGAHSWFKSGTYNLRYTYATIDFSSQSTVSGYSYNATFYGNSRNSMDGYSLVIGCPYVSSDSSAESGTFTTVSGGSGGGGDINVNVDIDMSETNGLLGDIKTLLQNIVSAIGGLFIPDDDFMDDFKADMQDLLEEHLGGLYEAVAKLDDLWDSFDRVSASSEIYVPPCNIPLAGSTLTLGDWHVPLKVQGLPSMLYEGLAWIIDFIATMNFLKMCRNKLEIFLNPDSEVISS